MDKVKDFEDLKDIPVDKLIKLLDKAKDYRADQYKEFISADERVKQIQLEISSRKISKEK